MPCKTGVENARENPFPQRTDYKPEESACSARYFFSAIHEISPAEYNREVSN
jgi:hypothetical protein